MPKLPRISGQQCIKNLERLGFVIVRQRGSHVIMRRGEPPIDFFEAFERGVSMELGHGTATKFCSIDDLIALKLISARPRDLEDVAQLRKIQKSQA